MTRREAAKGVPASHFSHRVLRTSCSSSLPLYVYRLTPLLSPCFPVGWSHCPLFCISQLNSSFELSRFSE
jgi:hypothetical protein